MENKNYQEDLTHIRQMMERSSRFISLSGLSGVFAGITALIGAGIVYFTFQNHMFPYFEEGTFYPFYFIRQLFFIALCTLIVALGCGYFFTARKSKKNNLKIWDATTKRLVVNFSIPLIAGGVFCLALVYHELYIFIAPSMLIFYGLALVIAERYTLTDVKYLGICEIVLGLIAMFMLGNGLLFWTIGFGILHIVYGIVMYRKYK